MTTTWRRRRTPARKERAVALLKDALEVLQEEETDEEESDRRTFGMFLVQFVLFIHGRGLSFTSPAPASAVGASRGEILEAAGADGAGSTVHRGWG
jgi:hypothetical protein